MLYILGYVIIINIVGFSVMGIDKWKAKHNKWRISERDIFTIAALGASIGIIIGMKVFHHKTLQNKFRLGIPFMIFGNIACIGYIAYLISKS